MKIQNFMKILQVDYEYYKIRLEVKNMEKAVIYVRVSSEEQAKHGFSIDNQKRQCEEFA